MVIRKYESHYKRYIHVELDLGESERLWLLERIKPREDDQLFDKAMVDFLTLALNRKEDLF